jgi:uncharacterized repeat protein (TIGR01451 family)
MTGVTVSNNKSASGGGLVDSGVSGGHISNSLFANNMSTGGTAGSGGGGILFATGGGTEIDSSEFTGNSAVEEGGGLLDTSGAGLGITSSTFDANSAGGFGGGLNLQTTAASTLSNVTISGNSGNTGGGLFFAAPSGSLSLNNDTIAFNQVTAFGGGIFSGSNPGSVDLFDTIVAKNTARGGDPDVDNNTIATDLVDGGNNFIGDNTGASDSFTPGPANAHGSFVGIGTAPLDPLLEPLADNGGTVVLPDGSHLLTHEDDASQGNNGVRDRGPTAVRGIGVGTDERGFPRLIDAAEDIGAFEFQDFALSVSTSTPAGPVRAGQPAAFTLAVTNNGPNTCHDVTLTATLPEGTTVIGATPRLTRPVVLVTFAVPDLAAGGSASFTLTVVPAAPRPFTETATASTHDDPNPANNTASATVTVLPAAFPATGFADVTALVRVEPQGHHPRRPHRLLSILLTNASSMPLQGPLGVVVPGLRRRGPKLLDASGTTAGGQKFVLVKLGGDGIFEPGQSAIVELVFSQPFRLPVLDVLAGAFA